MIKIGEGRLANGLSKLSNESYISLTMLMALGILFAFACVVVSGFFSLTMLQNLVSNYWYIIMIGIGVTYLLIAGYFDMSVGGIVAMSGVLSVYFTKTNTSTASELSQGLNMPYGWAIVLTILCCLGIAGINAFLIAKLQVASIIVTLGTMSLARGIAQVVTMGSQRNTGLPDIYGVIGNAMVPGTQMKVIVLIMIALVVLAIFIEKKTTFGRRTYLIGANPIAARLSGVKVVKHVTTLYMISAFLSSITGIFLASEFMAGFSNRGMGYEFDALVITLLGGTSISGGFGSIIGTVIGAMIISVVTSTATGLLLSPEWQFIIKGVATFVAILAQRFALNKRRR